MSMQGPDRKCYNTFWDWHHGHGDAKMPCYPQEADSKCEADAFVGLQHIHYVQRLQTVVDPLVRLLPESALMKQFLQDRQLQVGRSK